MGFAREAWPIVAPFLIAGVLVLLLAGFTHSGTAAWCGVVVLLIGLILLAFFRDPVRRVPSGEGLVVSPADGTVLKAETLSDGRKHLAVFLSVFNVHVNRVPISGNVQSVNRTPGTYFHAGTTRAEGNARVDVEAVSSYGPVAWRQVSGSIARKIACGLKIGRRAIHGGHRDRRHALGPKAHSRSRAERDVDRAGRERLLHLPIAAEGRHRNLDAFLLPDIGVGADLGRAEGEGIGDRLAEPNRVQRKRRAACNRHQRGERGAERASLQSPEHE